ncbi:MAG: TolB family protein, partial [bacterium]
VYVVRADGSGFKRLTDSTLNSLGPRWTAEGTISFTQNRYGVRLWDEMTPAEMEAGKKSEQTVVVRVDGSEVSRAAGRVARTDADLSPDGRFRVTTKNEGETWGVYVIEVSSGVERVVAGGTIRVAGK